MQVSDALSFAIDALAESPSPVIDARVLLCFVLNKTPAFLFTWPDHELDSESELRFRALVAKRAAGTPVAYLTGQREFWSLSLNTRTSTLIPRPETELLVEAALERLSEGHKRICDLGTGTGAVALAIACERPDCDITGVDRIEDAVSLAKENALLNQLNNVTFLQSNWFEALSDKFDMIVSNPPYVESDSDYLAQGDVRFEPQSALISGKDGLDDIRIIASQAPQYLTARGYLLIEHGFEQGASVRALLQQHGFSNVTTMRDLQHKERVTIGRLSACE